MPSVKRRLRALAALVVLAIGVAAAPATAGAAPIEAAFAAPGPSAVQTSTVTGPGGAALYKLYYPADIATTATRHPVVTWGNGSIATPADYPGLLNHLASWGYVVVASTSSNTGTGAEILAGAQYMVAQDTVAGSPFAGKIDTANIGAVGHSQGAGGAVNATTHSAGLIKTTVTWALPAPLWVQAKDKFEVGQLTQPSLFLGGQWDVLIAPSSALQTYYNQSGGPAAVAILNGADHNTIQQTGGGTLGYVTAWLNYRLRGDTYARGAFAGSTAEFLTNALWRDRAARNLP